MGAGKAPAPKELSGVATSAGGLGVGGEELFASELRKQKQGKSVQQRWCMLVNDDVGGPRFVYKKSKEDKKPKGVLALRGAWITIPEGTTLAFQSAHSLGSRSHLLSVNCFPQRPPLIIRPVLSARDALRSMSRSRCQL